MIPTPKPGRFDLRAADDVLEAERRALELQIPVMQSRLWHIRAELKRRRKRKPAP